MVQELLILTQNVQFFRHHISKPNYLYFHVVKLTEWAECPFVNFSSSSTNVTVLNCAWKGVEGADELQWGSWCLNVVSDVPFWRWQYWQGCGSQCPPSAHSHEEHSACTLHWQGSVRCWSWGKQGCHWFLIEQIHHSITHPMILHFYNLLLFGAKYCIYPDWSKDSGWLVCLELWLERAGST